MQKRVGVGSIVASETMSAVHPIVNRFASRGHNISVDDSPDSSHALSPNQDKVALLMDMGFSHSSAQVITAVVLCKKIYLKMIQIIKFTHFIMLHYAILNF